MLIKQFVGWEGDTLVLRQLNPPDTLRIPRDQVRECHLVVGCGPGRVKVGERAPTCAPFINRAADQKPGAAGRPAGAAVRRLHQAFVGLAAFAFRTPHVRDRPE